VLAAAVAELPTHGDFLKAHCPAPPVALAPVPA